MAQVTEPRAGAQMPGTRSALIVAHGSPSDQETQEEALAALARRVSGRLDGWQIGGATLAAPGRFEAACDRLGAPLIYPFFMADGWFTRRILAAKAAQRGLTMLTPFGLDPALPNIAAARIRAETGGTIPSGIVVAAHGSAVAASSAASARSFAARLGSVLAAERREAGPEIRTGYVEEPPYLADIATGCDGDWLCLPFFALDSGHVQGDIPEALTRAAFTGPVLPPLIAWEDTPDIIARSLRKAAPDLRRTAI